MKRKRIWMIPLLILILLTGGSIWYISDYYHADENALAALHSSQDVNVSEADYGWYFDGPGTESALVFYPGAKVQETSYAPLLHELAHEGIDVCLVKMPLRLAFFGINNAEKAMAQYDYGRWYIAGHSLGGVCASFYAEKHADTLDGLILLASYSTKKQDAELDTLLIYGSNDGVLNMDQYHANRVNLSEDAVEKIIHGGNHCQFGSYGFQKGDQTADISAEEQVEETVMDIVAFVSGHE